MERKAFIFHSFGDIHDQVLSKILNCEKKILEVGKCTIDNPIKRASVSSSI